jgi:hypothetical protein
VRDDHSDRTVLVHLDDQRSPGLLERGRQEPGGPMESRRWLVIGTVSAVLSLEVIAVQQPSSPPVPAAPQLVVTLDARQLAIRAERVALDAVLAELTTRTGIPIAAAPAIDSHQISAQVKAAPIDQAIRELLKNYDVFFLYSASARHGLASVWVYPRGAAANLRPVPPETWASTKELEVAVSDGDPSIREQAYEALMARADRRSRNLVVLAIRGASETDSDLRQRILSSALGRGMPIPSEVLADLVRADATEEIRLIALDGVARDPALRDVASAALSDPSEAVRARARDVLAELDAMLRRRNHDR